MANISVKTLANISFGELSSRGFGFFFQIKINKTNTLDEARKQNKPILLRFLISSVD